MNKKIAGVNEFVTREVLREELKNYATKDDVSNIVNLAIEKSEARTDERARQYRDQILTRFDQVMGELEQSREDKLFLEHDVKELKKRADGHEHELTALKHRQT